MAAETLSLVLRHFCINLDLCLVKMILVKICVVFFGFFCTGSTHYFIIRALREPFLNHVLLIAGLQKNIF